MVLNDVERVAKRRLIERNRERKSLVVVQSKLQKNSSPEQNFAGSKYGFQLLIDQVARGYCQLVDIPLRVAADFEEMDLNAQFNYLLKEILKRTFAFAGCVEFFSTVSENKMIVGLMENTHGRVPC